MNDSTSPAQKRNWTLLDKYLVLAPLLFGGLLVLLSQTSFFEQLEFLSMDYRFRARAELGFDPPASREIIRVGVDEESLAKLGRWPWDRTIHADLCQLLAAADIVVGVSIFFLPNPAQRASRIPPLRSQPATCGPS